MRPDEGVELEESSESERGSGGGGGFNEKRITTEEG